MAPGGWWASQLRDTADQSQVGHSYGREEASRRGKPSGQGKAGERTCQEADPPVLVSKACLSLDVTLIACDIHSIKPAHVGFQSPAIRASSKTRASKSQQRTKRSKLNLWGNAHIHKLTMKHFRHSVFSAIKLAKTKRH